MDESQRSSHLRHDGQPPRRPGWGRITTKVADNKTILYLHVFDWPADGKLPVAVTNEVVRASCWRILVGDTT